MPCKILICLLILAFVNLSASCCFNASPPNAPAPNAPPNNPPPIPAPAPATATAPIINFVFLVRASSIFSFSFSKVFFDFQSFSKSLISWAFIGGSLPSSLRFSCSCATAAFAFLLFEFFTSWLLTSIGLNFLPAL